MSDRALEVLTIAELEQQLADQLEDTTDHTVQLLIAAWVLAWSEVSGDLRDAVLEAVADGSRITSATIVRLPRLQKALAQIADRLDDLTEQAGITLTVDLADIVEQAVDDQIDLIVAQIERQALLDTDPDPVPNAPPAASTPTAPAPTPEPAPAPVDRVPETPAQRRDRDLDRRPPKNELDALIERFTERILSDLDPVSEETYEIIQRELTAGIVNGDNPNEVAARIVERCKERFDISLQRATVIARTEMLDAYREAARAHQAEHADVLAGWVWLAHLGPRTCRSCIANHGTFHELDEPGPIDHQQGRCSRTPVVKEDDGSYDLSWVPDTEAFFESLTVAQQQALLGKEGWKAWKAGKFPISAWSKRRTSDGWRDSMVPASPRDRAPVPIAG